MKEIFDWLREQMTTHLKQCIELRDNSLDKTTEIGYGHRIDVYNRTLRYITEAETKWKENRCEWKGKKTDMLGLYNSDCGQKSIVNPLWAHCPYCGKRIKIAEVE